MKKEAPLGPGQPVGPVPARARGRRFLDGGWEVATASREAERLIAAGVYYVDRYGVGWRSIRDASDTPRAIPVW